MIERYLSILEVSQKQAYIFSSNLLKDNVSCSTEIWWLTDPEKIAQLINDEKVFDPAENTVYAGGGHTVLVFPSFEAAQTFNRQYSLMIRAMNPKIELFLFTLPYCESVDPKRMLEHVYACAERSQASDEAFAKEQCGTVGPTGRPFAPGQYLNALAEGLERKKALRLASFRQGSFGIEKIDPSTRDLKMEDVFFSDGNDNRVGEDGCETQADWIKRYRKLREDNSAVPGSNPVPNPYKEVWKFEELGGTKGDSNFLAVVHIDGNGMGARVKKFYDKYNKVYCSNPQYGWENFRRAVREFSDGIDCVFKTALDRTFARVGEALSDNKLDGLSLKDDNFPMRGLIASGDDICFVTDGRIGIESAAIFIKELSEFTDYNASAGVAIVHQKYPFFRAYELAESLCSSAKQFAAVIRARQIDAFLKEHGPDAVLPEDLQDNGAGISAIDWHLEMGEIGVSLEEIREGYRTRKVNGEKRKHLEMRPYIVKAPSDVLDFEPHRNYAAFRKQMEKYLGASTSEEDVRARLKQLRSILRQGETETLHFINFHKLRGLLLGSYYGIFKPVGFRENPENVPVYIRTADMEERSVLFDAAETIDTFMLIN